MKLLALDSGRAGASLQVTEATRPAENLCNCCALHLSKVLSTKNLCQHCGVRRACKSCHQGSGCWCLYSPSQTLRSPHSVHRLCIIPVNDYARTRWQCTARGPSGSDAPSARCQAVYVHLCERYWAMAVAVTGWQQRNLHAGSSNGLAQVLFMIFYQCLSL